MFAATLLAATAAALAVRQDMFRGADTPTDVASVYVAAASAGDVNRALRLMPSDRADAALVQSHVERLRGVDPAAVSIEYVPHAVASYLIGARIVYRGVLTDELVLQRFGNRWYLVHFAGP